MIRRLSLVAAVLFAAVHARGAEPLNIGDPAPKLEVGEWLKGDPVKSFESGKTYVVEFWATWCGPCRTSIPHLSELQKKYGEVTVLGVSVWENDQADIPPFLKEMGPKMEYRVAADSVPKGKDGNAGAMAKGWMAAAGESGIPCAFVVDGTGKIAWIGHPMEIDEPLAKIVAGKYDIALAAKERKESKEAEQKLAQLQQDVAAALRKEKFDQAVASIDSALDVPAIKKQAGNQLSVMRYQLLVLGKKTKDAAEYGKTLVDDVLKDEAQALNNLAWMIAADERPGAKKGEKSERDLDLALRAAERASKLTDDKDPSILDTLAKVRFEKGDAAGAAEVQEKAVKLAGDDAGDDMKERLDQYKKGAEKPKK